MTTEIPVWPGPWAEEIKGIVEGNAALGPKNSLIKKLSVDQQKVVTTYGAALVTSLLDPAASAGQAKDILVKLHVELITDAGKQPTIQQLMKNPGFRPPSKLPVPAYNAVLELIVAKALWQAGHTDVRPWPYDGQALKPDFMFAGKHPVVTKTTTADTFYADCTEVADTLKVGSAKSVDGLLSMLVSGVTGKVGTYAGKQVGVVMEAADNPCLFDQNGELVAYDKDVTAALRERLTSLNAEVLERVLFVYLVMPGGVVVDVRVGTASKS